MSFLHNPAKIQPLHTTPRSPISWLIAYLHTHGLLSKVAPSTLFSALSGDAPVEVAAGQQTPLGSRDAFEALTYGVSLDKIVPDDYVDYIKQSRVIAQELNIAPGQKGLVVNGRVTIYL